MPIEYQGQTINSMKWNDQEILGGGSGGVETLTEDVGYYIDLNSDSNPVYPAQITFNRYKDENTGLYHVSFEFFMTSPLTQYLNGLDYGDQWLTSGRPTSTKLSSSVGYNNRYYPPEGWRPLVDDSINPGDNIVGLMLYKPSINGYLSVDNYGYIKFDSSDGPSIKTHGSPSNDISFRKNYYYGGRGTYVCDYAD